MVLFGLSEFFRRPVACKAVRCTVCEERRVAVGMRSFVFLHLFFIPIFPAGFFIDWVCQTCRRDADANHPIRAGWSLRLFSVGALFAWAGVMILLDSERRPDASSPYPAIVIGCILLLSVVAYWRRARRIRDEKAGGEVAPLAADACPLCGQRVLLPGKPRCEACRLDIIVK